ncbi:MAG: chromate efflux transporter [Bacteroidetes bacterium]|nr:chromate efflux transporter [Bacteroidota bacterium]MBS1630090.1 chromate efflux transporter [Bacteroidota bacterium]
MLLRHIPFLKAVALYSFTAFGGPQGHLGMMVKTFVQRRHDVTEEELIDFNAFANMLPGPSSTQTVMLIALKRGGIPLALVTLGLWILPAFIIMSACSFLLLYIDAKALSKNLFSFIQPMSVGFVSYAAIRMMKTSVRHAATWAIMVGSLAATLIIRSPWVFPAVLIAAGSLSNISNRRIPDRLEKPKPIRWLNLWLFAALFIIAGLASELARRGAWEHGRVFNLFENFYRFGTIVFGGGQALLAMMLYQFVNRPLSMGRSTWLSAEQLLTGYGLVQAVPGPVFSVCAFVGGMSMSAYGAGWQVAGCFIATIAIFLPSTLLIFFLFPVYHNLRHHVIIFRALEGINAAVVGIIWASGIVLLQTISTPHFDWSNLVVIAITFCLLQFTRIPAPFIVLGWLLLGWTVHF